MLIEEKYQELLITPSDINECFPLVRKSVEEGDQVVELGVRNCVSTWALLANRPKILLSVDVIRPPESNLREVMEAADEARIKFEFIQRDSTDIRFTAIDVLFIDTLHLYSHLVKELWAHSEHVRKRIIFHDMKIPEVRSCVQDFLYNSNWEIEEESRKNNGLTVVRRVSRPV